jgi:hypothetical protein
MLAQNTGADFDAPRCPLLYQIRASVLLKEAGLSRPANASHGGGTTGGAAGPGGAGRSGDEFSADGASSRRHVTFDDVPDTYFESLRAKGFDVMYLLGAWSCYFRTPRAGRQGLLLVTVRVEFVEEGCGSCGAVLDVVQYFIRGPATCGHPDQAVRPRCVGVLAVGV